jgi:hypothetical protein
VSYKSVGYVPFQNISLFQTQMNRPAQTLIHINPQHRSIRGGFGTVESPPFSPALHCHQPAAMVSAATRARLSRPAPASYGARTRERSPLAPGRAPSWRASAVNAAARDDDGRWQSRPERVPSRVWQRFRAPQSALPSSRRWVSSDEALTSSSKGMNSLTELGRCLVLLTRCLSICLT